VWPASLTPCHLLAGACASCSRSARPSRTPACCLGASSRPARSSRSPLPRRAAPPSTWTVSTQARAHGYTSAAKRRKRALGIPKSSASGPERATSGSPPPNCCTQALSADLPASEPGDQTDQLRTHLPAFVHTAAPFAHTYVWRLQHSLLAQPSMSSTSSPR